MMHRQYVHYIIVFLYSFLLYAHTLNYDVVEFDDDRLIHANSDKISDMKNITTSFKTDVFFQPQGRYYRPLFSVSLILDTQFKNHYFNIYHFSNILFSSIVCCLFLYLMIIFNFDRRLSLLVTLIFASHPILAFSVPWIGARNDILLALFFLVSIISMIKYHDKESKIYLAVHIVAFNLALYTKETALIFPLVYIFCLIFILSYKKVTIKEILIGLYWLASIGLFLILRSSVVTDNPEISSPLSNIIHHLPVYAEIFRNVVFPSSLSPMPFYETMRVISGIANMAVLGVLFYYAFFKNKPKGNVNGIEASKFLLGIFIFAGVLFPTTIVVMGGGTCFDYLQHRAYLPLIGVLIAISAIINHWTNDRGTKKELTWILLIIVPILGIISVSNSMKYADPATFYRYTTETSPNSSIAWLNMGKLYNNAYKNYTEAIKCYDKAIAINPKQELSWFNRGVALGSMGRRKDAMESYRRATAIKPDYNEAWLNMGVTCKDMGLYDDALNCYGKCIAIKPDQPAVLSNIGIVYRLMGNAQEAIKYYDRATSLDTNYLVAWYNKGTAYILLKQYEQAIDCFDRALAIDGNNPRAWANKAIALKEMGRLVESQECSKKANEIISKRK